MYIFRFYKCVYVIRNCCTSSANCAIQLLNYRIKSIVLNTNNQNDVEDEEHFIFDCSKLEHIRKHFFHRLASISPSFIQMSRIERLKFILGNNEYDLNVICLTYLHDMYTERTNLLMELGSC